MFSNTVAFRHFQINHMATVKVSYQCASCGEGCLSLMFCTHQVSKSPVLLQCLPSQSLGHRDRTLVQYRNTWLRSSTSLGQQWQKGFDVMPLLSLSAFVKTLPWSSFHNRNFMHGGTLNFQILSQGLLYVLWEDPAIIL